jgi:hypothetical protein
MVLQHAFLEMSANGSRNGWDRRCPLGMKLNSISSSGERQGTIVPSFASAPIPTAIY